MSSEAVTISSGACPWLMARGMPCVTWTWICHQASASASSAPMVRASRPWCAASPACWRQQLGSVIMGGRPMAAVSRTELARTLAVVPGSVRMPFSMTVREVVMLGRTPYLHAWAGPSPVDVAAVAGALGRVGIPALADRDVRTLSMGERQLTLIAMALAQGCSTLILDEPTVHLDLRHQVAIMELLVRLSVDEGMTVLAVLHDLSLAGHFFPRLVMLDQGQVVADGASREVLTHDRIRGVYGVEPRFVAGLEVAAGVCRLSPCGR